jgi:hypothetical protein
VRRQGERAFLDVERVPLVIHQAKRARANRMEDRLALLAEQELPEGALEGGKPRCLQLLVVTHELGDERPPSADGELSRLLAVARSPNFPGSVGRPLIPKRLGS